MKTIGGKMSGGDTLFKVFSGRYGSNTYVDEFVLPPMKGEGIYNFTFMNDQSGKTREELVMKGIVLQGVLMGTWSHIHKAISLCKASTLDVDNGAPHYVDLAWALYAGSETKGPIKLAEKRAPQFKTIAASSSEAGTSKVNLRLLEIFKSLQTKAKSGDCVSMETLASEAIAKMQVPVIQGMLREAYEVDPKEAAQHQGADGFVEVAEGWAFARAVLPSVAACSMEAYNMIVRNMDTLALGAAGPHVKDGYPCVKAAVESTYTCLGITCADVNAMANPYKTDELLWQPCSDSAMTTTANMTAACSAKSFSTSNSEVASAAFEASVSMIVTPIALLMLWLRSS